MSCFISLSWIMSTEAGFCVGDQGLMYNPPIHEDNTWKI